MGVSNDYSVVSTIEHTISNIHIYDPYSLSKHTILLFNDIYDVYV